MSSSADRRRYLLWKTLGSALEGLPVRLAVTVAEAFGWAAGWRRSATQETVATNLRRITEVGSETPIDQRVLNRWVRRTYASYGRYWAEGATLPGTSRDEIESHISIIEGIEHLQAAMAEAKGCIIALPHIGSWEWGGALLSIIGYPMTAVAEKLEPPELFEWFVTKREQLGIRIEPLDAGAGKTLIGVLRDGGVVGLLCDRDLEGGGVPVIMLGASTTIPAGPATLALRTGAALLTAVIYSGPGSQHSVIISPPISVERHGRLREDVATVSQQVADDLSGLIRRSPEQWHVFSDPFAVEAEG